MTKILSDSFFGKLLVGLGFSGLLASLVLAYERYSTALNPDYIPSCSISPIVACEKVMASGADSLILGIPNAFFGIAAFSALMTVGVLVLAGAKLNNWFWRLFYGVVLAGLGSVVFFVATSLYQVGSLCLYCMVAWVTSIALFVYSTIWLTHQKVIKPPKFLAKKWDVIVKNHLAILIFMYLFVFALILFRFKDYFESIWF